MAQSKFGSAGHWTRKREMMNLSTHTHKRPAIFAFKTPVDVLLFIPRIAVSVFKQLLIWQERATERHHLATLNEQSLKDIGLTAHDVGRELSKPFWRA
jgi:uncharacterized protein YjiS (DUF1127 family)